MAIVGVGGGLATSIASLTRFPSWLPAVIAIGLACLAVLYTQFNQPRRADELDQALPKAIVAGVIAGTIAIVVGKFVALAF